MNPYQSYSELLFTCVDGPKEEIVQSMLSDFNEPTPSDVEQALMAGSNQVKVIENGVSKIYRLGDTLPPWNNTIQYFTKEVPLDFSLAYVDRPEINSSLELRVVLWEPRLHPAMTVFMARGADGMSFAVRQLSRDSRHTWVNVRIHNRPDYPGCYFDYYAKHSTVRRSLTACVAEDGWEFFQIGAVQPFENPDYYARLRIEDRLNREIITEYMDKLGFLIARDCFWETDRPAHFIWQERPGIRPSSD
jgi:hypothetical protein